MRRLYLLRHGQTEYNASRRMQGQLDTQLSQFGIEQAHNAARYLAHKNICAIVSSDLSRAHDTALVVSQLIDVPVRTDPRLRETNLGQWQGQRREEVDASFPGARARWRHDPTWAPPGGETRLEVAARAREVVDELMRDLPEWEERAVLVVAHGGTISALTASLLGFDSDDGYVMLSGLKNTCWGRLTARPRYNAGSLDADGDPAVLDARFDETTINDAQWYLDGWNMGVALGLELDR
ncbi:histidine phosphatase family protein [Corynebacterium sp.]|uniref:histidine phosphatase family protein n=1 Tax=Corynebacterium sp. TaxID=1720 RepID=UPI0026DC3184|nr:histidine phosphatase family protein [Corynebacterium sp.]MDO5076110.1 histidine phosphatase family protein [Corynebacterium sp.]